MQPSGEIDELDRGRPLMDYELCRTLDELVSKLPPDSRTPVFAYSRPQDMSKLPRTVESGEEYRSFYAPYATKVHAIDGCFGRFIDTLKSKGRYDDSLIVLTADHGEMLGEDGRFGHSYHFFPQIVRVPLVVHLPASVARNASIDREAVSAEAVRGGDQYFEQDRSGMWATVKVTPGLRAVNQLAIRRHIDELSRLYKLPEFGN